MAELARKCTHFMSLVFGYSISAFIGVICIFRFAKRIILNPGDRFWKVRDRDIIPAVLSDPKLGNHAYIRLKNVRLHYVEKGDKSKPLMLFIHGFPEFWYSWRHQLKEFSSDYWVVAVDMRGYGDSDKPAGQHHYSIDLLVADIVHLISALEKETCTLVAHDWGGIIAWYLVLENPHLFDSYVIMNSAHPVAYLNMLKSSFDQFMKSWYIFFFQLPYLPELTCRMDDQAIFDKAFKSEKSPSSYTPADVEAYKYTFGKSGAFTCPINYYRANFMLWTTSQLEKLGKTDDFPEGLILYGDNDLFLNRVLQESSVQSVTNARLVCISGASHFVQQDDPVAVNREMRKFYNQLKSKENH